MPVDIRQDERDFWESNIKDEAIRAGLDPSGTVGCATLHLLGEQLATQRTTIAHWTRLSTTLHEQLAALREEKSKSDAMCEQMRGELATLRAEVKRLAGENLNLANILASEKCPRCAAHAEDDRKREELEHDRQTSRPT